MPEPIRILLLDDHSLFREAVARLLCGEADFKIAGEAATIEDGIHILKTAPVDIVLLDIDLGLQQGSAFPALARAEGFTGKILVVTAGVSKMEAARLLQRSCSGILLKHERPERLIQSIREAIGTQTEDSPAKERRNELKTFESPIPNPLTVRERQVLRGVFAGLTNKEIAATLEISEPLVKCILQQLFGKTGVRTRAQLVRIAVERYWKELDQGAFGEITLNDN